MGHQFSKNNPLQLFLSIWRHWDLAKQLLMRDIASRYRGSFGGLIWLVLTPLLMLSLYTVVFGVFMKVRYEGIDDHWMYALILYVGLIFFNFFSECMTRSPIIIISNANYVTKIVFPLEIYSWIIIGAALFHALINTFILLVFSLIILGKIHITILLLPILLLPFLLMTLGISWFLCAAGVYVRDIPQVLGFVLMVLMYLSPIFYSLSNIPVIYQKLLFVNPLTYIIEQARNMIIFGHIPEWQGFVTYLLVSLTIAWLGFIWFQYTKDGFADVL